MSRHLLRIGGAAALALAAAPLLPARPPSRWGAASCAPVGVPGLSPALAAVPEYSWSAFADAPEQVALLRLGRQVGTWRHDRLLYYPFDGVAWGAPCDSPVPPPPRPAKLRFEAAPPPEPAPSPAKPADEEPNYGVDRRRLSPREKTTINGREVTLADGLAAVGGREGAIPEDAGLPFLIDVGPEEQGRRLDADLGSAPELAPWRGRLRRQSYRPGDPMTRDRDGRPMYGEGLWVVAGDGKALGRLASYAGPHALASGLRTLRDFDPAKVPDLGAPEPPAPAPAPALWEILKGLPGWAWAVAGLAAVPLIRALAPRLGTPWGWLLGLLADAIARRLPAPPARPAAKEPPP